MKNIITKLKLRKEFSNPQTALYSTNVNGQKAEIEKIFNEYYRESFWRSKINGEIVGHLSGGDKIDHVFNTKKEAVSDLIGRLNSIVTQ